MSDVAQDEIITRYVMNARWIRSDGSLRGVAFEPRKEKISRFSALINQLLQKLGAPTIGTGNKWVTSIYRISGLDDGAIWKKGIECVAIPSKKTLLGRGDLSASHIYSKILKFYANNWPCRGHADIIDWPEEKEIRNSIASDLADAVGSVTRFPVNYLKPPPGRMSLLKPWQFLRK